MTPLIYAGCFMFLATVLMIAMLYSRIHWLLKATLIVMSLGFTGFFYVAHVHALGYPVRMQPASTFRFIYGEVREPNTVKDDPGAIYLWISIDRDEPPRAIAIDYSSDSREMITKAKKRIEANQSVYMSFNRPMTDRPRETGATRMIPDNKVDQSKPTLEFTQPKDTLPKKN